MTVKKLNGGWKTLSVPGLLVPVVLSFSIWKSTFRQFEDRLYSAVIYSGVVIYLYLIGLLVILLVAKPFNGTDIDSTSNDRS